MNIKIHHSDPGYPTLGLHQTCGNGSIIKNTKSLTTIGLCMMRAAREVDGGTFHDRSTTGSDRRAGRAP
jgi:hypothetical protein